MYLQTTDSYTTNPHTNRASRPYPSSCRHLIRIGVLAGLAAFSAIAGAQTDELVTITGHVPHTMSQRLDWQGRLLKPAACSTPGAELPAVVVMHGSGGMWTSNGKPGTSGGGPLGNMTSQMEDWAALLPDNGYVTLILDSFSARAAGHPGGFVGLTPPQDADVAPAYERSRDAFDALQYLRGVSCVDDDRIAVLGFSHGAGGVVGALVDADAANDPVEGIGSGNFTVSYQGTPYTGMPDPAEPISGDGFRCGVAYYPGAAFFGYFGKATDPQDGFYRPYNPLLMIYGENDSFWSNGYPTNLQLKAEHHGAGPAGGDPLLLESHAGLDHSFDFDGNDPEVIAIRERVLGFLDSCVPVAQADEHFANDVAVGDFNCDGADDLAIGIPDREVRGQAGAGMVKVVFGDPSNDLLPAGAGSWVETVLVARTSSGDVPAGGEFGRSLAAGKLNADSCDDLAVGAPGDGGTEGRVHVFYGGDGSLATPTLDPETRELVYQDLGQIPGSGFSGDRFGDDLAIGDLNGDLYDDLAITLPGYGATFGAVVVVYGGNAGITSWQAAPQFIDQGDLQETGGMEPGDGYIMKVAIGNFDGDAYDDLAVGFPTEDRQTTDDGYVATIDGSANGLVPASVLHIDQSNMTSTNPEIRDYFGRTLAAGDLDRDGFDDLVVASPGEDWGTTFINLGVAHSIYGSAGGLSLASDQLVYPGDWELEQSGFFFGAGLTIFTNSAFQNRANLAIGATGVEVAGVPAAGRVYVAYGLGGRNFETQPGSFGARTLLDRTVVQGSPQALAGFGSTLAAGDMSGNGRQDLIVGALWDVVDGEGEAGSLNIIENEEEKLLDDSNVLLRED